MEFRLFMPLYLLNRKIFIIINKITKRTTVDLAHKVHGKKPSEQDPPVIVLHGLLGSKKNWESVSRNLSASLSRPVVAVDIRNHGESPHSSSHTYHELASDVGKLLTTLSVSKADVIGHSMGGRTAMVLALTSPSKVSKLIAVDISPVSTPGLLNDFFPRLMDVMKSIDFTGLDLAKARALAKEKILATRIIENPAGLHFITMNIGTNADNVVVWKCNIDALKQHFDSIASFPINDFKGKHFDGPALFVGGELSNYLPRSDLDGIKEFFPKAEMKYIKNAGHNVHAENPTVFLAFLIEFLTKK